MRSLRARTLIGVSVLLLGSLLFAGLVLDQVIGRLLARAQLERMDAQLLALIAAAEVERRDVRVELGLAESLLVTVGSGLYAEIRNARGEVLWRSASLAADTLPWPGPPAVPGRPESALDPDWNVMLRRLAVDWETGAGDARRLVFQLGQTLGPAAEQRHRLRLGLVGGFSAIGVVTLGALALLLGGMLRPLGRIADEMGEMESGRRSELGGGYPLELAGVAANLNALLQREHRRRERYRASLGDLAHSLKTPLAALRAQVGRVPDAADREALETEIRRMSELVRYHLDRAAASGSVTLGLEPVEVAPIVREVLDALAKVYDGRRLAIERDIDATARFRGDAADLYEIVGNLLDNACKYARGRLAVSVGLAGEAAGRRLVLRIEDDGPGIEPGARATATARGVRLDERQPGQGIGLTVTRELVELYGGRLTLGDGGHLGGLAVSVELPGA